MGSVKTLICKRTLFFSVLAGRREEGILTWLDQLGRGGGLGSLLRHDRWASMLLDNARSLAHRSASSPSRHPYNSNQAGRGTHEKVPSSRKQHHTLTCPSPCNHLSMSKHPSFSDSRNHPTVRAQSCRSLHMHCIAKLTWPPS